MILQQLTVHNLGPFRGRQQIALAPTTSSRPIVLVGGLNGAGKTTILEALQLALYGKQSAPARASRMAYPDYLKSLIHRASSAEEGAAVELEFVSSAAGTSRSYRILRTWAQRDKHVRETVDVSVDGRIDAVLGTTWAEEVYRFLPPSLAHLFFFDGERIEGLADPEASGDLIRAAIDSLLGVDLIQKLREDLATAARRRAQRTVSGPARDDIAEAQREADRVRECLEGIRQETAHIRSQLERARLVLQRAERAFRDGGGHLAERRDELERELREAREEKKQLREPLLNLASSALPLALLRPALEDVREATGKEADTQAAQALLTILESRDDRLLTTLSKAGAENSVLDEARHYLTRDRKKRARTASQPLIFNLSNQARAHLDALLGGRLEKEQTEAWGYLERSDAVQRRIDELDRLLSSTPDEDAIARLDSDRRTARERVDEFKQVLANLEGQSQQLEKELRKRVEHTDRLLKREAEADLKNADTKRFLEHTVRARKTLEDFRREITRRHVARLERLILEGYTQLMRKEGFVGALEIAPETCTLSLKNAHGRHIATSELSAGERQLLAVSILWGLGKAAGRPLPIIIDTPLGRLDSVHRRNLVERYFPLASHQVVLLSTDEEIAGSLHRELEPYVSRHVRLVYHDADESTQIVEGYFQEAAS